MPQKTLSQSRFPQTKSRKTHNAMKIYVWNSKPQWVTLPQKQNKRKFKFPSQRLALEHDKLIITTSAAGIRKFQISNSTLRQDQIHYVHKTKQIMTDVLIVHFPTYYYIWIWIWTWNKCRVMLVMWETKPVQICRKSAEQLDLFW